MISSQTKRAILLILFALAALAVLLQWQQIHRLADQNVTLRDPMNQLSASREQDQKLISNLRSSDDLHQSEHGELLRLRSQLSRLKDAERENTRLRSDLDRLATASAQSGINAKANTDDDQSPEQQLLSDTRGLAKDLALALIALAEANDEKLPQELSSDFLRSIDAISNHSSSKITANRFELIYNGSLLDVADSTRTILLWEKDATRLESGEWAKTYGFTDAHIETWKASHPDDFARQEKNLQPL